MKKRALISVHNKNGVSDFAKTLSEKYGYEIVSTGSTAEFLRKNGVDVVDVKCLTGMEEMLNGKVKTLHPAIFAGILADTESKAESDEIKTRDIAPISIVAVNLYPFEEVAAKTNNETELVKNIDIGGVSLLRAAAKNYKNALGISSPAQYSEVLEDLKRHNGLFSRDLAQKYAKEIFNLTFLYDKAISSKLSRVLLSPEALNSDTHGLELPSMEFVQEKSLRYGENPHQHAALYKSEKILDYEVLQGKELSYNNILDMTSALGIASEFFDVACCAIIKHNTPCGVALGKDSRDAYRKALDCDPVSAFGGIITFTQNVEEKLAKELSDIFLEVIIAPSFSEKALEILSAKKNLRVVKLNTPLKDYGEFVTREIKITPFGTLVQDSDRKQLDPETFKTVSKEKPSAEMIEDMIFAWKVAKHIKSNAIVIAKDFKTLGICGGQTSRIDALEIAMDRACDNSKDAVLASDGFFPAVDNIHSAAQGRIKGIIQPGGSIKDKDVIAQADKYGMVMILTGMRHFKH